MVSDTDLSPTFDKTTNYYTAVVPYEVSSVNITGVLDDTTASAFGFGSYNLIVGENGPYQIFVLSASGQLNSYIIDITRSELNSAKLKSLSATEAVFDFYSEVEEYTFNVSNEITELTLSLETIDPYASYNIVGNSDFVVGMNTIEIEVTASDGVTTIVYTLNVNRQLSANNFLSYIDLSDGILVPDFLKTTVNYSVTVPSSLNLITISGETESTTSSVDGLGTHVLTTGNNIVDITVTSATGIARIYRLNIMRPQNTTNTLSGLVVRNADDLSMQTLSPAFNPTITSYSVMGEQSQRYVEFIFATTDPKSIVTGAGVQPVIAGPNTYQIIVTAEDGSANIYTVNLTRPKSSTATLGTLIPSVGSLDPIFDPETFTYTINLDSLTPIISFDATAEDAFANISGAGTTILSSDPTIIVITVTAEDGTTQDYTITVNQNRNDEARLATLDVIGYTLSPDFDPSTYTYDITVPFTVDTFGPSDVTATAIDPGANVVKGTSMSLVDGMNQYIIMVIAPDTFTVQTYIININKEVLNTLITTSIYDIERDGDPSYITDIEPLATITDFIAALDNPKDQLFVYDQDDILITDYDIFIGTGMTIKLEVGSTTYDQLVAVLKGDLNGDGIVNVDDASILISHMLMISELEGPFFLAASITDDDIVNVDDYAKLCDFVIKVIETLN